MGQFLNSINEVRKNYTKYDEWEQKQADERAQKEYGINVTADNKEVASKAETIILSVKPQFYASVIADIKDVVTDNQIIITIAPGKTLAWLEEQYGKEARLEERV